jgi:hypothetical protein
MVAEEARNLGLHSVRQQRSRAIAQYLCQRIDETPWLGQLDHIILGHGVSLQAAAGDACAVCHGPTDRAIAAGDHADRRLKHH